jgi:hypothetical protein
MNHTPSREHCTSQVKMPRAVCTRVKTTGAVQVTDTRFLCPLIVCHMYNVSMIISVAGGYARKFFLTLSVRLLILNRMS